MTNSPTALAEAAFQYYRPQDRDATFPPYVGDVNFTSPQDDHIDKTALFKRCFPTADRLSAVGKLDLSAIP